MRIRRTSPEPRMEMTPLLDVIFLLLTFFVFSLVLMVRAQVLGVSLPSLSAAEESSGGGTITLTLDADGACFVDGEPVEIAQVVGRVLERRSANPKAALLVAADTSARSGALLDVVDRLSAAGLRDFALVGRPSAPAATPNENAPREGGEGGSGEGAGPDSAAPPSP